MSFYSTGRLPCQSPSSERHHQALQQRRENLLWWLRGLLCQTARAHGYVPRLTCSDQGGEAVMKYTLLLRWPLFTHCRQLQEERYHATGICQLPVWWCKSNFLPFQCCSLRHQFRSKHFKDLCYWSLTLVPYTEGPAGVLVCFCLKSSFLCLDSSSSAQWPSKCSCIPRHGVRLQNPAHQRAAHDRLAGLQREVTVGLRCRHRKVLIACNAYRDAL